MANALTDEAPVVPELLTTGEYAKLYPDVLPEAAVALSVTLLPKQAVAPPGTGVSVTVGFTFTPTVPV